MNPCFAEIRDHLLQRRKDAFERDLPRRAHALVDLLGRDVDAFDRELNGAEGRAAPFSAIPILHHIPASDFEKAWRAAPVGSWHRIAEALQTRRRDAAQRAVAEKETSWIAEVADLLDVACPHRVVRGRS